MSEFETLYLVLLLVYLSQCLAWTPIDAVVFRSSGWKRWQFARRSLALAAWKRRGILLQVLPPLGSAVTVCDLPVVFSPRAIATAFSPGAPSVEVPWAAKQKFSLTEKSVLADGKMLATAHSVTHAGHLASLLQRIAETNPKQRAVRIDETLRAMLDVKKVEKRLRRFREFNRGVALNGNFLFFYLFVIAPLLVMFSPLRILWPFLVALLVGFIVITAFEFDRVYRLFYPAEARWTALLPIMLSPIATIRASDSLWNGLFHDFHPLAVAAVLCREGEFASYAARYLRELEYPLPTALAIENETQKYFRERLTRAVREMLAARPACDQITQPPAPESPEYAQYCPRCWSQYRSGIVVCRDCADLPLQHFDSAPKSAKDVAKSCPGGDFLES